MDNKMLIVYFVIGGIVVSSITYLVSGEKVRSDMLSSFGFGWLVFQSEVKRMDFSPRTR